LGAGVLFSLNGFSIWLGLASLVLVAAYPFFKRFTMWPQIWLGLTFNWGALLGWAAATGSLDWAPVLLYAGAAFWTLGYDTIYAHQDKEDDALVGIGSSALALGDRTKPWLGVFYTLAWGLWCVAGFKAGLGPYFALGMLAVGAHLAWQVVTVQTERPALCLKVFRANRETGALLLAAIILGTVL
jgi:4-hydroxybenzoate polyprenyltransferase